MVCPRAVLTTSIAFSTFIPEVTSKAAEISPERPIP
jgi:hypothetical protein